MQSLLSSRYTTVSASPGRAGSMRVQCPLAAASNWFVRIRTCSSRGAAAVSRTIVMQWAGRWGACDAGDGAEIFVDGAQVMIR